MKKSIKITSLIFLLFIVSITIFNLIVLRSIKTEIVINAPVDRVWTVLMDHPAYPEWNPFIKQITGPTQQGDNMAVTIQSADNAPMDFEPVVLVNNKYEEFRWVGKLLVKGVFDGEHYFILEQVDANQTRFIHGENFTGIFSGILIKMIGEDTEGRFNSMNLALKNRSENN